MTYQKGFATFLQTTKIPEHICKKEKGNFKIESHAYQQISTMQVPKKLHFCFPSHFLTFIFL
jgi:hypothetical protein